MKTPIKTTPNRWASSLCTAAIVVTCAGVMPTQGLAAPLLAPGFPGDTTADAVAGQLDFVHNDVNLIDGRGLNTQWSNQGGVAIDVSVTPNRVYVSDHNNHRVLGWADVAAFASHAAADLVIGQADFASHDCNRGGTNAASLCYPNGLAVDKLGNLYVADQYNHRVLFYTRPFAASVKAGLAASGVFGQYDSFTQNACNNNVGPDATTLCNPMGIALDTGQNLYVADHSNQRILVYRTPQAITSAAGSGDTTADQVLGQLGSFMTAIPNVKGVVDADGLNTPSDVALDNAGNLYVADHSNSRVLKYNKPLSSGNTTADQVFGQPDMASNTPNYEGSVTRRGLYYPFGVAVNGAGSRLFISDRNNHRVLIHTNPGADTAADQVIGQNGSFTTGNCNMDNPVSAKSLCYPTGIALDGPGSLHVTDTANNRVTKYKATVTSATPATGVLGQDQYTSNSVNSLDGRGFYGPTSIAIDRSVSPSRVYLAEYTNHRVLGWSDLAAFMAKAPATVVIGQPNFFANACNQNLSPSAKTLCNPWGVAVDTAGNLFVSDHGNHRVLRYRTPFTSDKVADNVFGQRGEFTTQYCNGADGVVSADTLCNPEGVAVDGTGNLYIADYNNHRVLAYQAPLSDTTADKVLGQDGKMDSNSCNLGGAVSNATLCGPTGVSTDVAGNLFVADHVNHRVLEYNTPLSTDASADKVFGQSNNFTTAACNTNDEFGNVVVSAKTLCNPLIPNVDVEGNLWVTDYGNCRALKYNTPLAAGGNTTADKVFGQGNRFNQSGCKAISPNSLYNPVGIAIDEAANVFIVDHSNQRVLQFLTP
ncbi:MAG: NHL repeat-containing protein [Methylococcus sp.]